MRQVLMTIFTFMPFMIEAADFVPPDDANIINVKSFGAKGDGISDDTAAIRQAIHDGIETAKRYSSPKFVWFPKGTYKVSDSIESRVSDKGWASGWRSGMILIGESETGTTIRLADKADGFGNASKPKSLVATGSESDGHDKNPEGGGNRAFRHAIINLTIDVGSGNPGAIGLDFCANNRGAVEDVTIRAPKDSGSTGLSLEKSWPGPALVKRVTVDGFARGIASKHYQYSMTFEHITLKNQRESGIYNNQNVLTFRDLTSVNAVPVVDAISDAGMIVIVDGKFSGGVRGQPAIRAQAKLYLRNLTVSGYGSVVDDVSKKDQDLPGETNKPLVVTEYLSGAPVSLFEGGTRSLQLPVEETPEFTAPLDQWVSAKPDIQAAIDSGKSVVYLPNGHHTIDKTLIIRGKVRRIIGMGASLGFSNKDLKSLPLIRFEDCGGDSVTIEHLEFNGRIEHASAKSLALRHCDHEGLITGPVGKTFIEDVIGRGYDIAKGHRLWARQLNAEFGDEPLIVNRGTLWILGYKTEGRVTVLNNIGGTAEIIGALFYPLHEVKPEIPCMINDGGSLSATYTMNGGKDAYAVQIKERRGDEWRFLAPKDVKGRGPALYLGVPKK